MVARHPSFVPDEWDKSDIGQILAAVFVFRYPRDSNQFLDLGIIPYRNHEPAADLELLLQRFGNFWAAGCDYDPVVRCMVRPALGDAQRAGDAEGLRRDEVSGRRTRGRVRARLREVRQGRQFRVHVEESRHALQRLPLRPRLRAKPRRAPPVLVSRVDVVGRGGRANHRRAACGAPLALWPGRGCALCLGYGMRAPNGPELRGAQLEGGSTSSSSLSRGL